MANNVKPAGTEKKPGVWKSFAVLMTSVKVPWVWVGLATLVSLFGAQLSLIIPDATAQVAAGDVSMGAILFMVGCCSSARWRRPSGRFSAASPPARQR